MARVAFNTHSGTASGGPATGPIQNFRLNAAQGAVRADKAKYAALKQGKVDEKKLNSAVVAKAKAQVAAIARSQNAGIKRHAGEISDWEERTAKLQKCILLLYFILTSRADQLLRPPGSFATPGSSPSEPLPLPLSLSESRSASDPLANCRAEPPALPDLKRRVLVVVGRASPKGRAGGVEAEGAARCSSSGDVVYCFFICEKALDVRTEVADGGLARLGGSGISTATRSMAIIWVQNSAHAHGPICAHTHRFRRARTQTQLPAHTFGWRAHILSPHTRGNQIPFKCLGFRG